MQASHKQNAQYKVVLLDIHKYFNYKFSLHFGRMLMQTESWTRDAIQWQKMHGIHLVFIF